MTQAGHAEKVAPNRARCAILLRMDTIAQLIAFAIALAFVFGVPFVIARCSGPLFPWVNEDN